MGEWEEPSANLLLQKEIRFGKRSGSREVSNVVVGSPMPPTSIKQQKPHFPKPPPTRPAPWAGECARSGVLTPVDSRIAY